MNRRSFIRGIAAVAAGFTILPAATTYARKWVIPGESILYVANPEWVTAKYEVAFYYNTVDGLPTGEFRKVTVPIRYRMNHGIWEQVPKVIEVEQNALCAVWEKSDG